MICEFFHFWCVSFLDDPHPPEWCKRWRNVPLFCFCGVLQQPFPALHQIGQHHLLQTPQHFCFWFLQIHRTRFKHGEMKYSEDATAACSAPLFTGDNTILRWSTCNCYLKCMISFSKTPQTVMKSSTLMLIWDQSSELWRPVRQSSGAPCRSGIARKLISLKFTEFRQYHQQTVHKLWKRSFLFNFVVSV